MILFISTFAMVFLMAFQQQNVIHGNFKAAFAGSFAIAIAQFALYKGVIAADYWGILQMGSGGAFGVTLSMFTHRRWRARTNMPLYEYRCRCGKSVELSRPVAERDDVVLCPVCSQTMKRGLAAPRAIFRGTGFPSNDNKPHNEGV